MNYNSYMNELKYIAYLSIYTKNLIIFKADERKTDRVHLKSISNLLNRRLENSYLDSSFFDKESTILKQFILYIEKCGEIKHLSNGYYVVLPERYIRLPYTKKVIKVGCMNKEELGMLKTSVSDDNNGARNVISLSDYRYDLNVNEWNMIFDESKKVISLHEPEYYKPTHRRYLKIMNEAELKDQELYHIISNPFENKREHFIAKKRNNIWYGERINESYQKSKLTLLIKKGYQPNYELEEVERTDRAVIIKITLSDYLPEVEMEQVFLFSSPQRILNNKVYYIKDEYLNDFIHVLNKLKFVERNVIK